MNHSQPCPDLIIYICIGGKLPTPRAMVVWWIIANPEAGCAQIGHPTLNSPHATRSWGLTWSQEKFHEKTEHGSSIQDRACRYVARYVAVLFEVWPGPIKNSMRKMSMAVAYETELMATPCYSRQLKMLLCQEF